MPDDKIFERKNLVSSICCDCGGDLVLTGDKWCYHDLGDMKDKCEYTYKCNKCYKTYKFYTIYPDTTKIFRG